MRQAADLQLLAVPLFEGKPLYRSYLIVLASDTVTRSILDLRGKVFAFSDPDSNSGWPAHPNYALVQLQGNPRGAAARPARLAAGPPIGAARRGARRDRTEAPAVTAAAKKKKSAAKADDGGCSVSASSNRSASAWLTLAAPMLVALLRRRRRAA